ncbi:MAG TPA: adenosylcobinamide-GDP ribazoletransferase [Oligoflexus sp.]|uniref:adenosylcobinamide-GDP ribazoletransferase n=1 Tax=Oligoflexus sp. TaxID=1971216 RepID=UPI002D57922F|nr:adenosylcobinamide-GDP ribazoletransferase [Oligoflexus sp.]HYX39048.1 adenosylcobinamide-GDP ribazoletransferase [Oligoflexus sp.]
MKVLQSFLAAVVTFTRIPILWHLPAEAFSRASLYLPVLGWLVGGVQFVILMVASRWMAQDVALFLALLFPCLLSAGMHEDGLADFADGMLGGHTIPRRLEIMKDPRVGSYGVLALLIVSGGGFLALRNTAMDLQGRTLLISAVLSRSVCIPLLGTLPYLNHAGSRSQGFIPTSFHGWRTLLPLWPIIPLFTFLPSIPAMIAFPLVWGLLILWLRRYLQKQLGGLTGDCLGAAIKICEFSLFLLACLLWPQSPP